MAKKEKGQATKEPRSRVASADRTRRAKEVHTAAVPAEKPRRRKAPPEATASPAAVPGTPRGRKPRPGAHAPVPEAAPGEAAASAAATPESVAVPEEPAGAMATPAGLQAPAGGEAAEDGTAAPTPEAAAGPASGDDATPAGESAPSEVAVTAEPLLTSEPTGPLRASVKVQLLKAALGGVVPALPSRLTLPVLSHVLLAAEARGQFRITGTDLDTTITRGIPASVGGIGTALVAGKKLNEIVRELPDGSTLDISLHDEEVVLICEETRSRFRLPALGPDEFPSAPGINWEEGFPVAPAHLSRMVECTAFAASTEESRPILNGVLWELREDSMTMVATNGHRLASARIESGAGLSADLIFLPRGLVLAARLAAEGTEPVMVAQTQNHAGFRGAGWEVITRLIEGPYPKWRDVVPKDNEFVLLADRLTLAAAVRRMAIVAETQTHRIRVALGGPMLRFSVANSGVGTASEEIPVEYDGDPLEIGFNALYLLELLGHVSTGEVRMAFKTPTRAVTIHPVDDTSGITLDVLVMPLRLQ